MGQRRRVKREREIRRREETGEGEPETGALFGQFLHVALSLFDGICRICACMYGACAYYSFYFFVQISS